MLDEPAVNGRLHLPSLATILPHKWSWARLDSVCDGILDCPHSTPVLTDSGPLMARSQDIRGGVLKTHEAAHVSWDTYRERVSRAEPRAGDLLYSREGTYFGIAAEVPNNTAVCLGQRMVLIRPTQNVVASRFLRFWLNSPVVAAHIHGYRDGTVAERLDLPTIRGLPVPIPPYAEQVAIGRILGSLDDKIDLNRRMNETLEAMARAIFKSWFVDFDPVRAKMEGRQPAGMHAETAALFPDELEPSMDGAIPMGWKATTLADALELHDSKRVPLSSRERAERSGPYPYYGAAGIIDHVDSYLFNGTYLLVGEDGSVINEDDTPVTQYVWGKFWVNNHAHVLTGKNGVCLEHLLLTLNRINIRPYVTGRRSTQAEPREPTESAMPIGTSGYLRILRSFDFADFCIDSIASGQLHHPGRNSRHPPA